MTHMTVVWLLTFCQGSVINLPLALRIETRIELRLADVASPHGFQIPGELSRSFR